MLVVILCVILCFCASIWFSVAIGLPAYQLSLSLLSWATWSGEVFFAVYRGIDLPSWHPRCLKAPLTPGDWLDLLVNDPLHLHVRCFYEEAPQCLPDPWTPWEWCLCVIGVGAGLTFLYGLFLELREFSGVGDLVGRSWSSVALAWLGKSSPIDPRYQNFKVLRTQFESVPVIRARVGEGHSHPLAAAVRNSAAYTVRHAAGLMGLDPYMVQQSNTDIKASLRGCRTWYWAKDTTVEPKPFAPKAGDAVCMIDVDMYLDMPRMLAAYPFPYMISTFQPTSVSHSGSNYSFTFVDDVVTYQVSGGASYSHEVWNYAGDCILATTRVPFTLKYLHTAYLITRKQLDPHHQLLLLAPIGHWETYLFSLSSVLEGSTLTRLRVSSGAFNRLEVMTPSGPLVSTGRSGEYNSATISAEQDGALSEIQAQSKVGVTMATVKTTIRDADTPKAAALLGYLSSKEVKKPRSIVYPVSESVFHYRYDPAKTEDAKPSLIPFMSPFMLGCWAPLRCYSNDARMIKGRVEEIRAEDKEVDQRQLMWMHEFLDFVLAGVKHTLHPGDVDEVFDRQARPSQRRILEEAALHVEDAPSKAPLKTFMKSEPYQEPKDPRNITTFPGDSKLQYCRFIYAAQRHIETFWWYAFSKTPREIAQEVTMICQEALHFIVEGDASRMDGRVAKLLRMFERMFMLGLFNPVYHAELLDQMDKQMLQRGVTKFGVKYEQGFSRGSGSGETAVFNTLDTAFLAYCALRSTRRATGEYNDPSEAWTKLGQYAGDDSITADVNPEAYVRVNESFGQVLEAVVQPRGSVGVSFLSRFYGPDVWHGSLSSICDIPRQLSKFHVTVTLPGNVTPLQKAREKAIGYALTDRETPVIGDIAKTILMCTEDVSRPKTSLRIRNWFAENYESQDQWPQDDVGGWALELLEKWLPSFDHPALQAWCKDCGRGERNVLEPPLCVDLPSEPVCHKRDIEVNGDLVLSQTLTVPEPSASGGPVAAAQPAAPSAASAVPPAPFVAGLSTISSSSARPPLKRQASLPDLKTLGGPKSNKRRPIVACLLAEGTCNHGKCIHASNLARSTKSSEQRSHTGPRNPLQGNATVAGPKKQRQAGGSHKPPGQTQVGLPPEVYAKLKAEALQLAAQRSSSAASPIARQLEFESRLMTQAPQSKMQPIEQHAPAKPARAE